MLINDLALFSFATIKAHKLRSLLTALGIIIGICAVVILTAIGEGIHRYVLAEFTQFGTNLIAIQPGKSNVFGLSGATINSVRPLTLQDTNALRRLPGIIEVVPLLQGNARIEAGNRQRRSTVFGVDAGVPLVWQIKVASGRFLPAGENQNPRAFAVLGSTLKEQLFGAENPLGQRIRVGSDRFRVIGVMQSKGQMLGFDLDDSVYIAAAKAMQLFDRRGVMEIDLLYQAQTDPDDLSKSITRLLVSRHGQEDFQIVTQQQMLETLDAVLDILTLAVGALGGISLLVGSVGIITIMTIAVSERIPEIGLLRAVGAQRRTIFQMFLCEAIWLSASGGVFGIILGISLVEMIAVFLPQLPVQLAWQYIMIAFALSIVIGLLAGVIPAMNAAKLKPLDALRAE